MVCLDHVPVHFAHLSVFFRALKVSSTMSANLAVIVNEKFHVSIRFDTSGPGSCFRRYSDPTFFRRVSTDLDEPYSEKTEKARKSRKSKVL